jgi:hypothetical protein
LLRFPYRASSGKENGGIFGRGFNNGNASVKTALGCYNLYRPAFIFGRAHRVISAPITGNLKSSIAHSTRVGQWANRIGNLAGSLQRLDPSMRRKFLRSIVNRSRVLSRLLNVLGSCFTIKAFVFHTSQYHQRQERLGLIQTAFPLSGHLNRLSPARPGPTPSRKKGRPQHIKLHGSAQYQADGQFIDCALIHERQPLSDVETCVESTDGQLYRLDAFANYTVEEELRIGQMPLNDMRGFVNHQSGEIVTRGLNTEILDLDLC